VQQLNGLLGGVQLGQVQLEARLNVPQLPGLEGLVAHDVRQVVNGHVRLIPRGLNWLR